jgi:hypothetical protein
MSFKRLIFILSVKAADDADFIIFQPYRDADKSEEVINIDETPSNHQGEKEEEWQRKSLCERRITLFEDVPSQLNDSCHKSYWFMQIIIFV